MSKEFGHTKTLFLQNGKYYKWSYKHTHCIECGNCDHKHKGNGLCTSCWDKKRDNNANRKETKKKAGRKWHDTNYVHVIEPKKKAKHFTKEMQEAYKKKWYQENRPYLLLKSKIARRVKSGLPCMKIVIKGETKLLPFETLEKPAVTTDKGFSKWQQDMRDYDILLKYYNK